MADFSFEEWRGRPWERREDGIKDLKRIQAKDRKHRYQLSHLADGTFVVRRVK